MKHIAGRYDKNLGSALLTFRLCGTKHALPGPEYTGIIDTGFTGFIQIPIKVAFSLALPLEGTMSVVLANGTKSVLLTALAIATMHDKKHVGTVLLSFASPDILIGMDFLRRFQCGLFVSPRRGVLLLDEGEEGEVASDG